MSDEQLTSLPPAQIEPADQAEEDMGFNSLAAQEFFSDGQKALLLVESSLARLETLEALVHEARHTGRRTAQRDSLLFVLGFASAAVFFLALVLITLYWR